MRTPLRTVLPTAGLAVVMATGSAAAGTAVPAVPVSRFAERGLSDWQTREFEGRTRYRLVDVGGRRVLDATAHGTASGLARTLSVDLNTTPALAWSWWVDAPVPAGDVHDKSGDDFAARVYVVFSGGLAFWRTTTVVYVWADGQAPAGPWRNPFTDHAGVFALQRGGGGRWHDECRDVAADYRRAFGRAPPPVRAVAIMTDTDQTGATAHARYGALRFVSAGDCSRSAARLDSAAKSGEIAPGESVEGRP